MKMNLKEMKTLYTFGCPNREATVERLRYVAALTPDPAAKKLFYICGQNVGSALDVFFGC